MTLALITAVPIAAALLLAIVGSRIGRRASTIGGAGALVIALGAAGAVGQAFAAGKTALVAELGPWLPIRGAAVAFVVDTRTVWLVVAIAAIGAALGVYAAVRLRRDAAAVRFFIGLDLLVASVLIVLMARDLVLLLVGWQGVGVAAYLLIPHDRHRPAESAAASHAFVLSRAGDAALVVAVLGILSLFQTVDLEQITGRIAASAPARPAGGLLAASLLIVVAALVRAGQVPFHTGMPGRSQTHAAALAAVHGLATAAGAILLIRLAPLLDPALLLWTAVLAIASAIVAMLAALADRRADRARWFTIAQLGIVAAACALGSPSLSAIVVGSSVLRTFAAALGERWPRLARLVSATGVAAAAVVLAFGPPSAAILAGLVVVTLLAAADALLGAAGDRLRAPTPAIAVRGVVRRGIASLGLRTASALRMNATLVERGGEQAIAALEHGVVRATGLLSTAIDRFHRASLWAHEALLVAAAAVIVAYWIVR